MLVLAAFAFVLPFTVVYYHISPDDIETAARVAIIPIFVLQAVLLMLKGTFSVAAGVTQEATEGVWDYQRLSPMTPLAKIVGYVLGLPIREYILVALLFPFVMFASVKGDIPAGMIFRVYVVFFSVSILYHMSGFLAGVVVKKKILAGVLTQILVLSLNLILPVIGNAGFAVFQYLTIYPVVFEQVLLLYPEIQNEWPEQMALFYDWEFRPAPFSIVAQQAIGLIFVVVVHRRMRNPANHLLGKHFSALTFCVLMAVLLGSVLPLIEDGMIFVTQAIQQYQWDTRIIDRVPTEDGLVASAAFGLISLIAAVGFALIITPTLDNYRKGLRRSQKLKRAFQPLGADSALGTWHMLVIIVGGAVAWSLFNRAVFESDQIQLPELNSSYAVWITLVFALPLIASQLVLESTGKKGFLMWAFFTWLVPILSAGVFCIVSESFVVPSIYLSSISGIALCFFAAQESFPVTEDNYSSHIHIAFICGLFYQFIAAGFFGMLGVSQKRRVAREILDR
ncbi:MAG: hypothetical protein AAF585_16680 [Verrucomicrobiota bacterium]